MGSFDPVWEEKYRAGHQQRAPWDLVVSFVFRFSPSNIKRQNVNILEVGCGTAGNLRFLAAEGFNVHGVDASASAIEKAKLFFEEDALEGDLRISDFTALDFESNSIDLVIDRASLTCVSSVLQIKAFSEIHRVLKTGGHFLYTPYANTHSSCKFSKPSLDGVFNDISEGSLKGIGQVNFISEKDLETFFPQEKWFLKMKMYETRQDLLIDQDKGLHSSWRIVLQKI